MRSVEYIYFVSPEFDIFKSSILYFEEGLLSGNRWRLGQADVCPGEPASR